MDKRERAELEAELVQIQADLAQLKTQMAALMPPERLQAVLRPLQDRARRIRVQLEESDTGASDQEMLWTKGPIYASNSIILQVAHSFWNEHAQQADHQPQIPPADLQKATIHYLTYLINRYRYLDFRGLGVADRVPLRLPLLQMVVPLRGRPFLPTGETWDRSDQVDGSEDEHGEPQPILTMVQKNDGLIVLGDPGSGKTTLLLYLTLLLATGQGSRMGLPNQLPLLLPLSAYAQALADQDLPLQTFIESYYRNLGIELPLDEMVREALARGGVLLLLDGLDEVTSWRLRHLVIDRVSAFFAFQRQLGNKMVLTSRLVGYREVRSVLDGVGECTLVDFDEGDIRDFIARWTRTVEQQVQGADNLLEAEVQREEIALETAVFHHPDIRRLATNPLLLTMLALMRRQNVALPQRRVELYDHTIKTLIKHWHLARGLGRPPQRDLDAVDTVRVLALLAFWMQERSPQGVSLAGVTQVLVAIFTAQGSDQPTQDAQRFLQDAREHTGLLLMHDANSVGFMHRTFQEYLAAVAVVQKGQQAIDPILTIFSTYLEEESWYEVLRLSLAVLGIVQQRDQVATQLLMTLLDWDDDRRGTAVLLAGDSLADLWPGGVTHSCYYAVMRVLQQAVRDNAAITPLRRMQIGAVWGRLGAVADITAVDAMPLCSVPGGPFWLGETTFESQNEWLDYPYWLARFPVTQGQFAEFVEDGGYAQARFWGEAQAVDRWENGRVQDWASRGWRDAPFAYGDVFQLPNHPVVGITWYEALAFTRWLTERWQAVGWLPAGWQVGLPSEIEWEKAARGGLHMPQEPLIASPDQLRRWGDADLVIVSNELPKRPYPWGEAAPTNHANYQLFGLSHTCSVGCFSAGRSPYGCEGMSGNVWEWTRSHFQRFPYVPTDGREESQVKLFHQMTLRGGAFWVDAARIRCAARIRRAPNDRHNNYGFRVVVREVGKGSVSLTN